MSREVAREAPHVTVASMPWVRRGTAGVTFEERAGIPTPCRSTGIGLALGVGRTGGILSAFAGSVLLAYAGAAGFFGAVGTVMLFHRRSHSGLVQTRRTN